MSYENALTCAGAIVHSYKKFGSYQGDWWAKVTYNGHTGWVHDYYGSCSGCDAFEAEFGYGASDGCEDHKYNPNNNCIKCTELNNIYLKRLSDFGKSYLEDGLMSQEEALKLASKNLEWDENSKSMVEFINSNGDSNA